MTNLAGFLMPDLGPVMLEIVMTCLALLILLSELVIKRKETIAFSIVSVAVVTYLLAGSAGITFNGMFIADGYSLFFKSLSLC